MSSFIQKNENENKITWFRFSILGLFIFFAPLALKIYMLLPKGQLSSAVQISGLIFLLFASLFGLNKNQFFFRKKRLIVFFIFVLLIFIAGLGSLINGEFSFFLNFGYILYPIICMLFMYVVINNLKSKVFFQYFFFSLVFYILTIVVLNFLGVNNPVMPEITKVENHSRLASLFGLYVSRQALPLANGFNQIGLIGGLSLIICFFYLTRNKNISSIIKVLFLIPGIASSLYVLFSCDAKISFFLSFFLIFLFSFQLKFLSSLYVLLLIFLSPLLFFLFLGILDFFSSLLGIEYLVENFGTLSHRTEFWYESKIFLMSFNVKDIIGYGFYSHYNIGLSDLFNEYTTGNRDIKFLNFHNNLIQSIFDFGYIGFVFIYIFYFISLNSLRKINLFEFKLGYVLLVYFYIHGITESIPNIYNREALYFFIGLVMISFMLKNDRLKSK